MLSDIKVISLDLDDTLWDCMPAIRFAEQQLYSWLQNHYPAITARYTPQDLHDLRAQLNVRYAQQSHDLKAMRLALLQEIARTAGYSESLAEAAFEVFYHARNQVTLYEDVLPGLHYLSQHYRLIALTNGNADLKTIGLQSYFSACITAAEAGAAKPAPAIFTALKAHAACDNAAIIHVGDNPEADIEGARKAGITPIWINRTALQWPCELPQPKHQVSCLRSLCALLGANKIEQHDIYQ